MRYSTMIASIFLLASSAAAHAAECQPVFASGAQTLIINDVAIEPGGRATQNFEVRVQNAAGTPGAPGATPCGATIRVARLGGLPGSDYPPFALSAPGNRQIEILADPTAAGTTDSDVVVANAPPGPQGRVVPFQIGVATEWGLSAGTFTEPLELLLIDGDGNIVDRTPLTVTVIIPATVSLRLVGAITGGGGNNAAQVDLGDLSTTRETRSEPFGARVFSTAPYVVSISSINLGNLLHEQGSEKIPYRLYYDGVLVDLAGSNEFIQPGGTPRGGDSRPMSVVVPPVVVLAGRYSDRITITVTAL